MKNGLTQEDKDLIQYFRESKPKPTPEPIEEKGQENEEEKAMERILQWKEEHDERSKKVKESNAPRCRLV